MSEYDKHLHVVMDVIRPFIPEDVVLDADTLLIENAQIDSLNMINILLELESRLGIQLKASDLTFDHFQSCRLLANSLTQRID